MKTTLLPLALVVSATLAAPAFAYEKGDIVVRVGLTQVAPDDSSSPVLVGGDASVLNTRLSIDNNTQLGLNIAYFITDKINVELLAATPFKHDVNLTANGAKLAEVTHLPPTVTVNYFFADPSAAFQPYVGAGVNYTFIFDEEFTQANKDALGVDDLKLDNSFGLSAQVGFDYMFSETMGLNASIRYIDIDTEATFNAGTVESISIDPMVYTLSLAYKF
jgi:outer membrane protein